jgi:hypothetical protein
MVGRPQGGFYLAAPRRLGGAADPAPAAMRRTAAQETGGFRIGQNVAHAKFGQGVIVNAEGRLGRARAGEFRPRGRQVAGAVGGETDGGLRRSMKHAPTASTSTTRFPAAAPG